MRRLLGARIVSLGVSEELKLRRANDTGAGPHRRLCCLLNIPGRHSPHTRGVKLCYKAEKVSTAENTAFFNILSSLIAAAIAESSLLATGLAERLNPSIFTVRE